MSKICHITLRHSAFDTRIFYKECASLKDYYPVVLLAPNAQNAMVNGIEINGFRNISGNLQANLYQCCRSVFRQKAVLYHIHDAALLPLALILLLTGKKVIIDVNDEYRAELTGNKYSGFVRRFLHLLENVVLKKSAVILSQRFYISRYQGRTKNLCVVENFCDTMALKPHLVADRSYCQKLFYSGLISYGNGSFVMLAVLHELRKRGLDLSLDIAGKLPDAALMKEINKQEYYFGLKNQVRFHGDLSLSETYRIAEQSFAGICMNEETQENTEVYPTVLFEYMAVGLPVVASNISLYKAVVERRECGICVSFGDTDALADAIEKIYTNKDLQKKFSANGPDAVVKNYNWNFEKNILLDFYRKIIR